MPLIILSSQFEDGCGMILDDLASIDRIGNETICHRSTFEEKILPEQ